MCVCACVSSFFNGFIILEWIEQPPLAWKQEKINKHQICCLCFWPPWTHCLFPFLGRRWNHWRIEVHPGGFRSFYLMPMDVFGWRFYQVFLLFGTNSCTDICIWHKGAAAAHDVSCSWSRASASSLPVRTLFVYWLFSVPSSSPPLGTCLAFRRPYRNQQSQSHIICKLSVLYSCFVLLCSDYMSTKCHREPKCKEIYSDSLSHNSATWIIIRQTVFCIKPIQEKSFRRKLVIMW